VLPSSSRILGRDLTRAPAWRREGPARVRRFTHGTNAAAHFGSGDGRAPEPKQISPLPARHPLLAHKRVSRRLAQVPGSTPDRASQGVPVLTVYARAAERLSGDSAPAGALPNLERSGHAAVIP
jgi:hypothetical protein